METVRSSLRQLQEDLSGDHVKNVRVLFVPYKVLTRVRLTPELLQQSAEIDRTLSLDRATRDSLIRAIEMTEVSPLGMPPDLRWGAIFFGADGMERHSIYLDGKFLSGTGRQGIIDRDLAKVNGALVSWFEDSFGHLMREKSP